MVVLASTIQWGGLVSAVPGWLVGVSLSLSILLAAGLVVALYRSERSRVPKSVGRWLMLLRTLVISIILAAILLDPAWVRSTTESIPGTVLIAVDQSDSMRLTEPQRPLAEKFHLVEKFNLSDSSSGVVRLWKQIAESGGVPKFAGPNDPEKASYEKAIAAIDSLTRHEANCRILNDLKLLARLKSIHSVELIGFDSETKAFHNGPLPAKSGLTDLSVPLKRAAEIGPGLVGVVLMSDGRQTWGTLPDLTNDAPFFPVVTMSRQSPTDIAIVSAKSQSGTALKGAVVPIDVKLNVSNWPSGLVNVTVTPPNGKPVVSTVGHPGGDATYSVTLKVKLDEAGSLVIPVVAEGAGAIDRHPENNRRSVSITVVKDKARVLLIDSEPRWEFHYLHTALGRDPNIDLRSVVFRQPRMGSAGDAELRTQGFPSTKLPDPESLSAYDLVILGDVLPGDLPVDWRQRLERFVADQGGTIVLSAGKQAMPRAYTALANDPIRRLLPFTDPVVLESDNGSPLELTPDADRYAFVSMADTTAANSETWNRFPLHSWAIGGAAKPGATVLATFRGKDKSPTPVILAMPFGFGRVISVGIDSTWRWRFKAGDQYHHRFWGQVAQWAASDRLLPAINAAGTIRFGPREPSIEAGRESSVVVRFTEDVKTPTGLSVANIYRLAEKPGDGERLLMSNALTTNAERPRERTAVLPVLPPGRYAIELNVPEWANDLSPSPLRAPFTVTPPESAELADVTPDWAWLESIAKSTGGAIHTVDTLDQLVESLTAKQATRESRIENRLRHSWWLFGTIVGLLGVEWIIRKWHGLA